MLNCFQLLHSLEEDEGSLGRQTPRKRSTKSLHHQIHDHPPSLSHNTSPKTPSLYSNMSPPHQISPHDINGSLKSNPMEDSTGFDKEEEISLLPTN